jgi:lipopolysaccharide export system protein LptA
MKSSLMRRFWIIFLILISLSNAYALKTDKDQPTKLSSDNGSFNDVDQEYILTGNVIIKKGSILVTGNKAVVIVDPDGYQQITIRGDSKKLAFFSQQVDKPDPEFIEGYADIIVYEAKKDQLLLSGQANALRKKGLSQFDTLTADKINYDLYTEEYSAESFDILKPSRALLSPRIPTNNILTNSTK